MLPPDAGPTLLALARAAIGERWGGDPAPAGDAGWLQQPGATFVTLAVAGALRGCVGTVEPYRPLSADVTANAVAAAFHDGRFPPLRHDEFDILAVEVSLLSALEPLPCRSAAEACARLRPGVDGVVLACGRRRATFLPQVWARVQGPEEFLALLRVKAGLPATHWDEATTLRRYTVTAWHQPAPAAVGATRG